jgi:small subunit ribosomal protein S30e
MPTHGSLTKAGKVRGQTPKVEGRKRVGTSSSLRNKSNFRKRFILARVPGQNKPGRRRRPRRN